ncbi:MAG: oligosaccharide flippase family protein [Luteolibacter sp.]
MSKNIIIYTIGNALNRFCALLMFPIYAKTLTTDDFAIQDITLTFGVVVGLLIGMGIDSGYSRRYYDHTEVTYKSDLATTWGSFSLASISLLLLITIFAVKPLTAYFISPTAPPQLLTWALIAVSFGLIRSQLLLQLRLRKEAFKFACVSFSSAFLQLALVLILVWWLKQGSLGVIRAYALSAGGTCLIGLGFTGWIWKGRFSFDLLKKMLLFGLPLLPAALAVMGLEAVNKFMLLHLSGESQTAVFGVGSRIAGMLGILMFGFQMAWAPIAFEAMSNPSSAVVLYEKASRWLLYAGGIGVGGLILFSPEIIQLLSKPQYLGSRHVIPFVCLSLLIWSFYYIVCVGYQYANKSYHQAIAMVFGLVVVIVVSWSLIPKFGAAGAAASMACGYLISLAYAKRASDRYLKVCYQWARLLSWILGIVGSSYLLMTLLFPLHVYVALSLKTLFSLSFFFIGGWVLFTPSERASAFGKITDQFRKLSKVIRPT